MPGLSPGIGVGTADKLDIKRPGVDGVVREQAAVEDLNNKEQAGYNKKFGR